jgi:hypothetical protein
MISCAIELYASIDAMAQYKKKQYDKYLQCLQKLNTKQSEDKKIKPKPPPMIINDMLNADNWDILNQYLEILELLKQATEQLQGRAIKDAFYSLVSS